ncbi:MAG TPA: hypothetical protein VFE10_08780 [Phenylobacterium sp.]|jgi:hypothetical protein|nr:hypothetical protein [Phenylobacterium sp.]
MHFHATPEITVWAMLGPPLAATLILLSARIYLLGAVNSKRRFRSDLADALPPQDASRLGILTVLWWSSTPQHRRLDDREITRSVYVARTMVIVTLIAWIALFQEPPDGAERLAAFLNSHGF